MGFERLDIKKNRCMLTGPFKKQGYDWWWHSLTAVNEATGESKAFFFEYFLCNPALAEDTPVFGQLPANKESGKKPSYLMVKAGTWGEDHCQLHRFFAWKDVTVTYGAPYKIEADDCLASETAIKGSIHITPEEAAAHPEWMCDAGDLTWDLTVDKQIAFNVGYGTSPLLCALKAFEMYWHAQGMKSAYSGTIIYNGEAYKVIPEKSYGYADKNWGRNFTSPWIWLSSNHMISNLTGKELEDSVFDIGGGCPKVYFVPLPKKLLGAFQYEGKGYEYNFSKFWKRSKTRFEATETEDEIHWNIIQEDPHSLMHTKIRCKKKDMLLVNYESPDGQKRHNRLWNGGNGRGRIRLYEKTPKGRVLIDDINVYNVGCEYGEYT